jgi:Fe-S oxidoreductase
MKQEKLTHARRAGAEYICTACTHCQIQYDRGMPRENIQAVPFAMLLGAALEIKEKVFTDWTHSNI